MPDPKKPRLIHSFRDELVELPLDTQRRFHLVCWQRWRDFVGFFWPRDGRFDLIVRLFEQGGTSLSRAEKLSLRAQHAVLRRQSEEPRSGVFVKDMSMAVRGAMELAVEDSIRGRVEAMSNSYLTALGGWVFQLAWLPKQGYLPPSMTTMKTWQPVYSLSVTV